MVTTDSVATVLPKVGGIIGKITNLVSGGVTNIFSIGNIFFMLIILGLLFGIYKLWRIDLKNKEYFRHRNREI